MKLSSWYKKRGKDFIFERAKKLNERYGFSPQKSMHRIEHCMEALEEYGCSPTFAVPGMVVERNTGFIQRIQQAGAEIAVHGYNHVDLKTYTPADAGNELQRAAQLFQAHGLEVYGFRCPYLSATDDLLKAVPPNVFEYSSNKAIQWPIGPSATHRENVMFDTILGFYLPQKAETTQCLPWFQDGLVEIPVCVPDDLQLHDGLGYGLEEISRVWLEVLHLTHQRGEVFNMMFHPELASFCEAPFLVVLKEARSLRPGVWFARLRDISAWWKEKAAFRAETECADGHIALRFHCTPRATVLCRGFEPQAPAHRWDGDYWRLEDALLPLDGPALPLIGLPPNPPAWVISALTGSGYLLETGENARSCSLYLDEDCLGQYDNPVDLIAYIERAPEPLVRFWPWPDGNRSALCITGDLDALSLLDYAYRLLKN